MDVLVLFKAREFPAYMMHIAVGYLNAVNTGQSTAVIRQ